LGDLPYGISTAGERGIDQDNIGPSFERYIHCVVEIAGQTRDRQPMVAANDLGQGLTKEPGFGQNQHAVPLHSLSADGRRFLW
jgi:hypothetical protein